MKLLQNQKGQASIFMALFITTMILLFAFTTNIGMLVHAKINLQNAADSAAYAGAAVQARQLTNAAYLNWEMRRALKEFLYLYMFRGNRAQGCMPNTSTGARHPACPPKDGNERYRFAFNDPREALNEPDTGAGDFYLPTVCIIFDESNNYCQKSGVPGIPQFPGSGSFGVADPIVAAVRSATDTIINKKIDDCNNRTFLNQQFILAWLFNVNPLAFQLSGDTLDADDPFDVQGLDRLGVLPRMAILRARIDNLEEALNMNLGLEGFSDTTITEDSIGVLKSLASGNKTLEYFERPIQAYLSARNNLPSVEPDNGIFTDIELSELIPNRTGSATRNPRLQNPPVLVKFNDLTNQANFSNSRFDAGAGGSCSQSREIRIIEAFPFGITKDPNILTYYAVRLQAKARLLFSPFGSDGRVTLSAYSAAKPFGSRIGKDLSQAPNEMMVARAVLRPGDFLDNITGLAFPNPLVAGDDNNSFAGGFSRNSHIGYLNQIVASFNRRDLGFRIAGAYSPWEIGYYTIPANFQSPENIGLFTENPVYDGGLFRMRAPLLPVNNASASLSFLRDRILAFLDGSVSTGTSLSGNAKFNAFKEGLLSDARFGGLFAFLEESNLVENHLIPDPLLNDQPDLIATSKGIGGERFTVAAMANAQKRQLTSWNNQKTALDVDQGIAANSELGPNSGRAGYSVRFISFNALTKTARGTNDPANVNNFENPFSKLDAGGDSGSRLQDDIRKIKH